MNLKAKVIIFLLIVTDVILIAYLFLRDRTVAVFQPSGLIAIEERNVFFFAAALGLSVIVPIVLAIFFIAWKYRADNPKAKYTPDWHANKKLEVFRWSLMCLVIGILAVVTVFVAHSLDPFTPLKSETKPITIQVVALQWRWLFIYPNQHIATINYAAIPEKTPVIFNLTADAPMNSFWVPQLGGQIYAMAGMSTQTHMMANTTGTFYGSSAEISGKGFANMRFAVQSMAPKDFNAWVNQIQNSPEKLTSRVYTQLAKPNEDSRQRSFTLDDNNLYNNIMMKYMEPGYSIQTK
jgi:cytochrome o ubiquinol oxidase subunit 2